MEFVRGEFDALRSKRASLLESLKDRHDAFFVEERAFLEVSALFAIP